MKSFFLFVAVGFLAVSAFMEESKAQPAKAEIIKARYSVSGLHCAPCTTTVENSLKKAKGIVSVKVDFSSKNAVIEFDENLVSAQEVAGDISGTPHMMGKNMQYGAALYLGVAGIKDKATADKAAAALVKVQGVAKVTPFPQQEAVAIEFTDKGKVTTKQLMSALESAGLKGTEFVSADVGHVGSEAMIGSPVMMMSCCGCCRSK